MFLFFFFFFQAEDGIRDLYVTGVQTCALPIWALDIESGKVVWEIPQTGPIEGKRWAGVDRKSTRLNSSHVEISYAVFCLKKKKKSKYCSHMLKDTDKTQTATSI